MWNSCPIRFYGYFILVSRRLLLTNYRVQLHSPNNHNSKAATSIARWFFANEKNYLTSLESHGHEDGIITTHELQTLFVEGGMEEAKALSNEDFVKALQTIGIDIESEQGLLSSSSIGTSFASFRDSHTESIAAEETKAVEQKKEPIEQPSSQASSVLWNHMVIAPHRCPHDCWPQPS